MLIKFTASWCGKCRAFHNVEVDKVVDVDNEEPSIISKFDIKELPTFILMDGDKEVKRLEGPSGLDEFESWINDKSL